jgi:hypothetical protein
MFLDLQDIFMSPAETLTNPLTETLISFTTNPQGGSGRLIKSVELTENAVTSARDCSI